MPKSKFSRKVEAKALEFAQGLDTDMTPEQIKTLFDTIEEEHALIEAKLTVMSAVYRSVLEEAFTKEDQMGLGIAGFQ